MAVMFWAGAVDNSYVADAVSCGVSLVSALIVATGVRIERLHLSRFFMIASQVIGMLHNIMWFVETYYMNVVPTEDVLLWSLTVASPLFMAFALVVGAVGGFSRDAKYTIFADAFYLSVFGFTVLSVVHFGRDLSLMSATPFAIANSAFVFINMLMLVTTSLVAIQKGTLLGSRSTLCYLSGTLLFVLLDLAENIFERVGMEFMNPILVDSFYLVGCMLVILGLNLESTWPCFSAPMHASDIQQRPYQRVIALVTLGIGCVAAVLGWISVFTLMVLAVAALAYWILAATNHARQLSDELLRRERQLSEELTILVSQRTRESEEAKEMYRRASVTDELTGLYNRRHSNEYLSEITSPADGDPKPFTIYYFDLNGFKPINDTYGHDAGDEVLAILGTKLLELDIPDATFFRMGGDEFMVVVPGSVDRKDCNAVAQKIMDIFARPIGANGHLYALSCSMGIARFPLDVEDPKSALGAADQAMYSIKRSSRPNNYCYFSVGHAEELADSHVIEERLRSADIDNDFILLFQPQFDVNSGDLVGCEALLRWDLDGELVSPGSFMVHAKKLGLMAPLATHACDLYIEQISRWAREGRKPIRVDFNLTGAQLGDAQGVDVLLEALECFEIAPEWVSVEIDEQVAMDDHILRPEVANVIRAAGISISVDHFGRGRSSIPLLMSLGVNRLKIDASFMPELLTDEDTRQAVGAIINMCDSLGMEAVALGVERREQLDVLRSMGCSEIQGYFSEEPLATDVFESRYLSENPKRLVV